MRSPFFMVLPGNEHALDLSYQRSFENMRLGLDLFSRDCWKALVISGSYDMGDPLAPSTGEENREGGGLPAIYLAGITRS
jgi:hypothetical protein